MAVRLALSIASILIFLTVFIRDGGCSPNGVPVSACEDTSASIGHDGVQPQTTPSPFITRANQTRVEHNSDVHLQLQTTDMEHFFKGFFLMALDVTSLKPIGTFSIPMDERGATAGRTIDCSNGIQNAVSHVSNNYKRQVNVTWTPPLGFHGDVVFRTTYVINLSTHWMPMLSDHVNVGADPNATTTTSSTTPAETEGPISTEKPNTSSSTASSSSTTSSSTDSSTPPPSDNTLTIVLIVVGSVLFVGIIGGIAGFGLKRYWERRNYQREL